MALSIIDREDISCDRRKKEQIHNARFARESLMDLFLTIAMPNFLMIRIAKTEDISKVIGYIK